MKMLNFLKSSHKADRLRALLEIRLNQRLWMDKPQDGMEFENVYKEFPVDVYSVIASGEAEAAVSQARKLFAGFEHGGSSKLPFPVTFNADISVATLIYAFARGLHPDLVLESGVGYGISSALVLLAMDRSGMGMLKSLDLPALADPDGVFTGIVVPGILRSRWQLRLGSSRMLLSGILQEMDKIGLFISDSANVFTLQKYEYEMVFPRIESNGVLIFNNISSRFQHFIEATSKGRFFFIWQVEKESCVTALIIKD